MTGSKGCHVKFVDRASRIPREKLYELTGMTGPGLSTEEIRALARSPHFLNMLASHWFQFALPALKFVLVLSVMIFGCTGGQARSRVQSGNRNLLRGHISCVL